MRTLFVGELADRELGRAAVRVSDLRKWCEGRGLFLRASVPLDDYDAVQLEALLCSIQEAAAEGLSDDGALDLAKTLPAAVDPRVRDSLDNGNERIARFLIGQHAHGQWRLQFEAGIKDGSLTVIDGLSGLPMNGPATGAVSASGATAEDEVEAWKHRALQYADEAWRKRVRSTNPSKGDLAEVIRRRFLEEGVQGSRGPLSAATIERQALRGWIKPVK